MVSLIIFLPLRQKTRKYQKIKDSDNIGVTYAKWFDRTKNDNHASRRNWLDQVSQIGETGLRSKSTPELRMMFMTWHIGELIVDAQY